MRELMSLLFYLLLIAAVHAREAPVAAIDLQLEQRVMAVAHELRCLVCQNQSIADSNAPLALDLREQVREKLKQGMSKDEIVTYMVARYGDFVRYRPPLDVRTMLLWFGPGVLLITGLFVLFRRVRASRADAGVLLNESDRARVAILLGRGQGDA